MESFILRRLGQALFTIAGVMLLTFLLFRVIAGDVSASYVSAKAGPEQRQAWLEKHGLDKPAFINPDAPYQIWTKPFWDTQFVHFMKDTVTFQGRSFSTNEKLTEIIAKKAPYSLAITVPALAAGWLSAMVISCFVAYYRNTWIDRVGVFISVLGMCFPFLAYMILGQWLMFQIKPEAAWGMDPKSNIYLPVAIAVVAGLGGSVRFYRTIILDQIHQDYVRTARAKGVPLPSILFIHVLKNCTLPILTNLVLAIPFLIMGSLLLEGFFGINGLGDLMLSSVFTRDVPIITGLTFLTALIYVSGLLITDILYAVFDPRIRLQ